MLICSASVAIDIISFHSNVTQDSDYMLNKLQKCTKYFVQAAM